MTMQQFTVRGINFGPTRMVNERNAMATPSERSPQVREPSDCGEQTLFSSLFPFPFPSFLSFFLQADMAMARVNAEPKRQPTRTILSFLSFPPNLGYLLSTPATKVWLAGFQLIRLHGGLRYPAALPPGLSPGPNATLLLAVHLCRGEEEALQIGGGEEALQVGAGPGPGPRRTSAAGAAVRVCLRYSASIRPRAQTQRDARLSGRGGMAGLDAAPPRP